MCSVSSQSVPFIMCLCVFWMLSVGLYLTALRPLQKTVSFCSCALRKLLVCFVACLYFQLIIYKEPMSKRLKKNIPNVYHLVVSLSAVRLPARRSRLFLHAAPGPRIYSKRLRLFLVCFAHSVRSTQTQQQLQP